MRIVGALTDHAEPEMRLATPNFTTGYYAASVDLGSLQEVLGRAIARFDMALVEERWEEILGWMRDVLRAWVQRYKHLRIERRENGIRVEIETQDDHGYYSYAFDVLPGRQHKARK
jgi:hypothetical protein